MDIEKVNTTLDRALLSFHEDREASLMSLFDEDDDDLDGVVEGAEEASSDDDTKVEVSDPPKEAKDGAGADVGESYTGTGGQEPVDHTPMGDPETGDSGGVDNPSHEAEAFLAFVADLADDCAGIGGYDRNDVLDAIEVLTTQMAEKGEIPPVPNPDTSSAEQLSAWPLAAKTAGLAGRLAEYMKSQKPSMG